MPPTPDGGLRRPGIVRSLTNNYYVTNIHNGLTALVSERVTKVAFAFVVAFTLLGLFGPMLAPYETNEIHYAESGGMLRADGPSLSHPLGTTTNGYDVLSRLLVGAQPTMTTGYVAGFLIVGIGLTVGMTAGYLGGWVENVLMRFVDFTYSIPVLPFAIVLITFLGGGYWTTIFVIGIILWRGNARVFRSEVLQLKERPFVVAAKASGASTIRIIGKYIVPNIMTMVVLFFVMGFSYGVIIEASLAFLGFSDPFVPSWGIMLRNVYNSGMMHIAWWWALPPAILLSASITSVYLLGRGYEQTAGGGASEAEQLI